VLPFIPLQLILAELLDFNLYTLQFIHALQVWSETSTGADFGMAEKLQLSERIRRQGISVRYP